MENFIRKNDIFNKFAQNIDCGYTLEPPRQGCSIDYQESMFWIKKKEKIDVLCPIAPLIYLRLSAMVGRSGRQIT